MEISTPSGIAILRKLISAAGWHSNQDRLIEAVPHMSDRLSSDDLVATLNNLALPIQSIDCRLQDIGPKDCPALFLDGSGSVFAILEAESDRLLLCELDQDVPKWTARERRYGRLVRLDRYGISKQIDTFQSFAKVTREFRSVIPWLALTSLMTNLMGLATPLLIMVIYDRIIPSGSVNLIWSLALAVVLVVACDASFRYARTASIAYMGREMEQKLGLALFRKLLALPANQIQHAEVEQQITRFRQFESLRDVFTGQVLTTLLDLPFTLLFLLVLFLLSPLVATLIAVLMAIFVIATIITLPKQKVLNQVASKHKASLQSHVYETIKNQASIQRLGLIDYWAQQNLVLNSDAAIATRRAGQFQLVSQGFGQSLMSVAGIGAIMLSTLDAMNGSMTFGALIAVMSLVWKTLTPLQAIYSNAPQIAGFLVSKKQSDRVLGLAEETTRGAMQTHQKKFNGTISFAGVTHRYDGAIAYALSQMSLDIEAGDFVLIGGANSSGKSTLLNLICGLYKPFSGSIHLDGIDLRQVPVDDLRQSISYVEPNVEFFYGTIFQNFRLAIPSITEREVEAAIASMGLSEDVRTMPEGIHTRLSEAYRATLSDGFLAALSLARGLARPGSVLLLNDPTNALDDGHKAALAKCLRDLKGQRTILLASQDPVHMEIANRFLYLDRGRLILNDKSSSGFRKFAALSVKSRGK